jgi:M26 IgA1-specific Metallo-endopeptidase N-terminal region/The GLUG motif
MKSDRASRRSVRSSIFIGVLVASIFSGSGAFADLIPISSQTELEAIGVDTGKPLDGDFILNNSFEVSSPSPGSTYISGIFTGTFDGNGKTISELSKPLFDVINGPSYEVKSQISNLRLLTSVAGVVGNGVLANSADSNTLIENIGVEGKLNGEGNSFVGGLVGSSSATIRDSYSSADVEGASWVGGLVGKSTWGTIENSYATGDVTSSFVDTDTANVGGLAGEVAGGNIKNSYATGDVLMTYGGSHEAGGLVGKLSSGATVENSFAAGAVTAGWRYVGGLVGENNSSTIDNSFASGAVTGSTGIGGLVGGSFGAEFSSGPPDYAVIKNSGATGTVTLTTDLTAGQIGSLVGNIYYTRIENSFGSGIARNMFGINIDSLFGLIDPEENKGGILISNSNSGTLPNILSVIGAEFLTNSCYNSGHPYLVDLIAFYKNTCSFDSGSGDTPVSSHRERVEREVREVAEARTPENVEKSIGFKNETPLPKNAAISFADSTVKIDLAKIKAVEIAPTVNVKVSAKTGEALQISLKSESKEPVELWVKSPDGSWLLAGVITFDKDGKAILPPLQFKNTGDYSLVLSKPSAGSAKGSAPLNQTGSLLVVVS